MSDRVPTRVAMYAFTTGEGRRVAEFRWSPQAGVVLEVIDPESSYVAEEFYEKGVPVRGEPEDVQASDGPRFMQALLRRRATYYSWVDESDQPEPASPVD